MIRNISVLCTLVKFYLFITIQERIEQYQRKNIWVYKNHVSISFWKPTSCMHCYCNGTWKDLAYVNSAKLVPKSNPAHSNRESYLRNSKNENELYNFRIQNISHTLWKYCIKFWGYILLKFTGKKITTNLKYFFNVFLYILLK